MSNNEDESSNCKPSTSQPKMEVDKKNSHSEIEKRRRDKMNQYITDLSTMIPLPPSVSKKPDKLTVLKYAVQHMKALQGSTEPLKETNHRPSFISDDDLRNLITEATSGFIIVIECDRGQVLYVSDSVRDILNISQENMVGFDFYELVHNKDVSMVKAQLSTTASDIKEDKFDVKKPSALKEVIENSGSLCPGAKRSFLCRMKMGTKMENVKNVATNTSIRKTKANVFVDDKNPILISYEGYLKSWPPKKEMKTSSDPNSCSCLVAVGRIPEVNNEQTNYNKLGEICEFETRQRADATFIRVDQSFVKIFGYLPEDVIGKSAYNFFHRDDYKTVAEAHYKVFHNSCESRPEIIHRFRAKAGHYIPVKTTSVVFRNPWSKEVDQIATRSFVISSTSENIPFNSMKTSSDGSSSQQDEIDENLRLLLFKLENLDNDSAKSQRKRTLNGGNGKPEDSMVINHPSDIGVLLAEEAKKVGKSLRSLTHQSAKYTNVERSDEAQQGVSGKSAVSPHDGNVPSNYREAYDVDDSIERRSDEENSLSNDGILAEQLDGIQSAIDAMENPGDNEEEDSLTMLMNVIQNEDLSNVLNDMPWNVI